MRDKNVNLAKKYLRLSRTSRESLQIYSWYAELSQAISEGAASAQKLYQQLLAELETARSKVDGYTRALEEERYKIETQLNSMAEKSGQGDFKTALSRRKELTEELSKISGFEKDIREKQAEIEKLYGVRRSQIVPALNDAQSRIYKARVAKAMAIGQKLSALKAAKGMPGLEHLGNQRCVFTRTWLPRWAKI